MLQMSGITQHHMDKSKYFGVAFVSDGRRNKEIDTRVGKAHAVLRELCRSVVIKRELSNIAKWSIFKSVFVAILTYGHESLIMTERILSQPSTSGRMGFLQEPRRQTSRLVHSCDIRKALNVEPFSKSKDPSYVGSDTWSDYSRKYGWGKSCWLTPTGKQPRGRPKTRWSDYISDLVWPVLVWSQHNYLRLLLIVRYFESS